ncbi:hypothetical protein TNCV_912531 [Trichonephila clavipes]|nr:hypothetical protein TNCV_912531 [Trichonephila clavipes]
MKHRYDSKKQLNLAVGENNSTRPSQLENQNHSRRKTAQLSNRNEATQLNRRKPTQLGSKYETTQLCAAVDRLHRLCSRIGFSYLLTSKIGGTFSNER